MVCVSLMKPICWLRDFEEFSQSFVKPKRNSRNNSVQISMCCFVPKIFGNPFLPWRKDGQCRVGLNETCPAAWKPREVSLNKSLIVGRILE
jgi:hypothetical protein